MRQSLRAGLAWAEEWRGNRIPIAVSLLTTTMKGLTPRPVDSRIGNGYVHDRRYAALGTKRIHQPLLGGVIDGRLPNVELLSAQ